MVLPALALIGFMVLMTLVIALGTVSTNRGMSKSSGRGPAPPRPLGSRSVCPSYLTRPTAARPGRAAA